MKEIEKFRNLLTLLEQLEEPNVSQDSATPFDVCSDEDEEAAEWASLIVGAGGKLKQEARMRTCRSGLAAVNRYMVEREAA